MNTDLTNSLFHSNGTFYKLISKFKDQLNIENPTHADSIDYLNKREETLLISSEIYLDDYMENCLYYTMKNFTQLFVMKLKTVTVAQSFEKTKIPIIIKNYYCIDDYIIIMQWNYSNRIFGSNQA